MRILKIHNNKAVIEVDSTELDNILNNYLDQQYILGYDNGYNDWTRACENADVDDDDPEKE